MDKNNVFEIMSAGVKKTTLPEKIDVWTEMQKLFVENAAETKKACDEISEEANEFMKFFGYWNAIEYVKVRMMRGYTREQAAGYVMETGRPIVASKGRYIRDD